MFGVVAAMLALALSLGFCVQDDTYISLRYARNFVDGHGLVYNPGERAVEGYTNFLWTAGLAGVLALGLNGVLASVWAGLLSAVALVWAVFAIGKRSQLVDGRPWVALLAPALVATDPGLLLEAVQGLETVFFTLLVTAMVWTTVQEMTHEQRPPWSALLGGLAALTRPEGYLFYGLLQLARLLHKPRLPARGVLIGWGVFGILTLSHLAWRWGFYGDVVPNTFHAKTGGGLEMWQRGFGYVGEWIAHHFALVGLALVGAWAAVKRASARDYATLLVITVYLLYVIRVGGDFKPTGRFLLPVLPVLALWAQDGLGFLLNRLERRTAQAWVLAAALVGLAGWNFLTYWPKPAATAEYRVQNQADRVEVGEFLRARFPPGTWIAIHSAGTVPYISGLPTIDCWGLSDHHIARVEVADMGQGEAGHEKTDYGYVFGQHPTVYLPELDLVSLRPKRLFVPHDFPRDFEAHYSQYSAMLPSGQAVNFWLHQPHDTGPPEPATEVPPA